MENTKKTRLYARHGVMRSKKGFTATLPFLMLCILFVLLSVVCLAFALFFKDTGTKDQSYQSTISSAAIALDFAQLQTDNGPMYKRMSDKNMFFAANKDTSRQLFESIMGLATAECYAADWYMKNDGNDLELLSKVIGKNNLNNAACPNLGVVSVVLLPSTQVYIHNTNSLQSPIAGVILK